MKITAGNPLERGKDIAITNSKEYITKLLQEEFNGYVCIMIKGIHGLQEGVILIHNGKIVAASYDYFYYMRQYTAEPALERTLNAMMAKTGVLDTFSLSSYQVQLVLTLNEEAGLKKPVDAGSLKMPEKYSEEYEKALIQKREEQKKGEIAKKLGLGEFLTGMTKEDLLKIASEEDDQAKRMIK